MTQILEVTRVLSAQEREQAEAFAEFLISRRPCSAPQPSGPTRTPSGGIDVSGLIGICAGMGGDKSSVELVHEAYEARASKYEND